MEDTITISIDAAGRLVVPKELRERLGLKPGVPIEITLREGHLELAPAPRDVRLERRGGLTVAVPLEESGPLRASEVEKTRRELRGPGRR